MNAPATKANEVDQNVTVSVAAAAPQAKVAAAPQAKVAAAPQVGATANKAPAAPKSDRFLAVFSRSGVTTVVTSPSARDLRGKLTGVPAADILQVWKGKRRDLQTKTVLDF